ncbi:MAG: hypothetical protein AB7F82_04455 [Alphaproteobacteria bacterium]
MVFTPPHASGLQSTALDQFAQAAINERLEADQFAFDGVEGITADAASTGNLNIGLILNHDGELSRLLDGSAIPSPNDLGQQMDFTGLLDNDGAGSGEVLVAQESQSQAAAAGSTTTGKAEALISSKADALASDISSTLNEGSLSNVLDTRSNYSAQSDFDTTQNFEESETNNFYDGPPGRDGIDGNNGNNGLNGLNGKDGDGGGIINNVTNTLLEETLVDIDLDLINNTLNQLIEGDDNNILDLDNLVLNNTLVQTVLGDDNDLLDIDLAKIANNLTNIVGGDDNDLLDTDLGILRNRITNIIQGNDNDLGDLDIGVLKNRITNIVQGDDNDVVDAGLNVLGNVVNETIGGNDNDILELDIPVLGNVVNTAITGDDNDIADVGAALLGNTVNEVIGGDDNDIAELDMALLDNAINTVIAGDDNDVTDAGLNVLGNTVTEVIGGDDNDVAELNLAAIHNVVNTTITGNSNDIIDADLNLLGNNTGEQIGGDDNDIADIDLLGLNNSQQQSIGGNDNDLIDAGIDLLNNNQQQDIAGSDDDLIELNLGAQPHEQANVATDNDVLQADLSVLNEEGNALEPELNLELMGYSVIDDDQIAEDVQDIIEDPAQGLQNVVHDVQDIPLEEAGEASGNAVHEVVEGLAGAAQEQIAPVASNPEAVVGQLLDGLSALDGNNDEDEGEETIEFDIFNNDVVDQQPADDNAQDLQDIAQNNNEELNLSDDAALDVEAVQDATEQVQELLGDDLDDGILGMALGEDIGGVLDGLGGDNPLNLEEEVASVFEQTVDTADSLLGGGAHSGGGLGGLGGLFG